MMHRTLQTLPPPRSTGFNPAINGFRGVCVLLVFGYHVANSNLLPAYGSGTVAQALEFFLSSWRYGVELFFMISGYVIVTSLRRQGSVTAFLRDRCLRIFPVWIPVCVTIFAVGATIGWKIFGELSAGHLGAVFVANLLLLPPLLPIPVLHPASWSLSYEWLFYLLAGAAFVVWKRHDAGVLRVMAWCLWGAATLVVLWYLPRAVFFLPGVILAMGWLPIDKYRDRGVLRWPGLTLLVMLLSWRAIGLDLAHPDAYSLPAILGGSNSLFLILALLAGLHLFACVCAGEQGHWLCRTDIQFLGNISYSFYLWHPIVMFAVKQPVVALVKPISGAAIATAVFAVASFCIALLLSWLSYRLLERGVASALRRRFERRRLSAPLPVAPAVVPGLRVEGG